MSEQKKGKSFSPWTEDQVEILRKWQEDETKHPFTCLCGYSLIPAVDGWFCEECGRTQNWCHNFMLSAKTPDALREENKKLKDALEFYADGKHYEDDWFGGYTSIESDKGKMAREALK